MQEVSAGPNEDLAEPSCGLCVPPVCLCSERTDRIYALFKPSISSFGTS